MGSVRKRGASWRAEVRRGDFYRSMEFRTKAGAEAWITQTEADYIAGKRGQPGRHTLNDALMRYKREVSPKKRGHRWEAIRLDKLSRDMACRDLRFSDVKAQDIATWRDERLAQVSPASVNREWNLLRSVFSVARREWGWVTTVQMRDVSRPPSTNPRRRRVAKLELDAILRDAEMPNDHGILNHIHRVALAFELAIETGMRAGEIRTLTDEQIDLATGVVRLTLTKNGDARDVPLSSRARAILARLVGSGRLFPMTAGVMDATFRRLRDKAGIDGLHFHDSRAEAATRLSKKVDVLTLARILGHRDLKSLMVYYRESAEDIAKRLG